MVEHHAREKAPAGGERGLPQEGGQPEVTVVVPPQAPVLTPSAAAALLRLLHAVRRRHTPIHDTSGSRGTDSHGHPGQEERRAAA